jgi:hypothetical protein
VLAGWETQGRPARDSRTQRHRAGVGSVFNGVELIHAASICTPWPAYPRIGQVTGWPGTVPSAPRRNDPTRQLPPLPTLLSTNRDAIRPDDDGRAYNGG